MIKCPKKEYRSLHLAERPEGRYEDYPLLLIGTYIQKGRNVVVE